MTFDDDDATVAIGFVVDDDRGSLPYHLVHGEALVAAAAWALGEAGVDLVDLTTSWTQLRELAVETEAAVVLHDSLCPLTSPDFLAACVERAVADPDDQVVVIGVRPVTDTLKRVDHGRVGATIDRDQVVTVCSPVVLPPIVVAGLDQLPPLDFAVLASVLGGRHRVVRLEAPAGARRVASDDDLRLLEALPR